ncbi:normal mucosa of esophagus-specific gene 1 protein [Callorhinchus milii]|nr:normal mucosa of esophagus-specific gene 1 protein [Callorhinchus milii]XP_042199058.1 normal mucosa of esophagus-specific gene 1 protein [Callorhinchus milii]AFM85790.1 normal mucosa of esophagus specific 1 [Callorhinchus milii]AFM85797.1 normal mucosa of esophagus specific 1 [Callorhinchus milii]AFM86928.1 normal mucosa of esophagus specific 1 [Callorhinchus milii]AFM86972.1 normal mucosa of esophagus specific 1 [Callorhinchus milii]AFM89176.1 normal mucosa of esophagus specific 1 [Callo|eukprot:gi/632938155/ref/XP_007903946.1/ PREDICTED: normal mucosa of esophagus-specific gene 1 protein [Callorhinchus milii]
MTGIFQMIMKKKELIPIVGLMLCAATGATSTAIYFLLTKSDVIIDKRNNPTPWENIDPTKPQKLRTISQEWRPLEELEMLKKYK